MFRMGYDLWAARCVLARFWLKTDQVIPLTFRLQDLLQDLPAASEVHFHRFLAVTCQLRIHDFQLVSEYV